MDLLNATPALASFVVTYLHIVGGISTVLSALAFYFLLCKTQKSGQSYTRYLVHVQVWVVSVDLVVCLFIVPVPLFPLFGTLCYGLVCNLGLNPHWVLVLALFSVGNVASSINMCFHYRFEAALTVVRGFSNASKSRSRTIRTFSIRASIVILMMLPAIFLAFFRPLTTTEAMLLFQNASEMSWILENNITLLAYPSKAIEARATVAVILIATMGTVIITTLLVFFTFDALRKNVNLVSERTRNIQKKLTRRLIIQSIIPVTVLGAPLGVYLISVAAEIFDSKTNAIFVCIQMLHSVVHSVLIIVLSDSYRKVVARWFGVFPGSRISTTTIPSLSVMRLLLGVVLLAATAAAVDHVEATCTDLKCASRESLLSQIAMLKKDVHERDQILADSDCTACYSNPCQNEGQCLPDGKFGYRCDCPDDTAGANCEKRIVCDDKSCGKNANCYIQNHQTNCVCATLECQYINSVPGDAKKGCSLATRRRCFNGDPHYQTFDGATFDYQATCPYIFSLPCKDELDNGYSYYSVQAKNDIANPGQTVSYVTSTQVVFYNKTIFVDRYLNVFVDGVQVHVPYSYPSQLFAQFSINYQNPYIVIKNDQFVQVEFKYSELCLTIPDVPEFRGATTLCGLAGNLDGNCNDDIVNSDGTVTPINNCRPSQAQTDTFADSWRTVDYTQSNPAPACIDGQTMTNKSATCQDVEGAGADCVDIFNAQTGKGPFAQCQVLGNDAIQRAYDSCIYDVCLDPNLRCNSLLDFVHQCQFAVGGVNIDNWRATTGCEMNCPAHSTYTTCVSGCPATCAAHDAPSQCNYPCAEGCACDYGYVLDTTSLATVTCVRVDECGCTDSSGNMHPANQHWLSNDCSQANYCQNGTYFKNPYGCQPNAHCGVANGEVTCLCDPGFEYNQDTNACDDIDECLDPNSCSTGLGHGLCVNTPGSYYCQCNQYYAGHDCETFAPRRHCADLFKYHGATDDGAYTGGGGWTLIGNAFTNETAEKTLEEYAAGFGSAEEADLWFGLDLISLYTNYQMMSLRLNLFRCSHNGVDAKWTDCTYKQFAVSGKTDEYRVTIPEVCRGTEIDYYDGWARWDLSKTGPKFIAFDNDNSTSHCSATFRNTGWWYDTSYRCGSANLNGVRYTCDDIPQGEDGQTYLFWNGDPINKADMYIRPTAFPNYD